MLGVLLSSSRSSSRDAPSFVGRKAAKSWASSTRGSPGTGLTYGYSASRELTGQIPGAGPFIKAMMPQSLPGRSTIGEAAPLRFLIRRSDAHPVTLTIDNVQFMPFAVRELLDAELAWPDRSSGSSLSSRVCGASRLDWRPPVPNADFKDVELGTATAEEVAALVAQVLPEADGDDELAASVFGVVTATSSRCGSSCS